MLGRAQSGVSASFRSIWISDVHLGTRECRAEFLLDFLNTTRSEYLYLVGDIVDLLSMRRGLYWSPAQNDVVRTILKKAKSGVEVTYIPGNHDDLFREFDGMAFGAVRIRREAMHVTSDGRRFLVLHGDEFDGVVRCGWILKGVGTAAHYSVMVLSRWFNGVRRALGLPYWSLAAHLKERVPSAKKYIRRFDEAVARAGAARGADGLICGHIHRPELLQLNGLLYCNDGDWVENCTALVEHHDGRMELVHWSDRRHSLKSATDENEAVDETAVDRAA